LITSVNFRRPDGNACNVVDVAGRSVTRATLAVLIAVATLFIGGPAQAGCHAFTLSVSPTSTQEGGGINVTVRRDGEVDDSSVRVSTINESATSPADYSRVNQVVSFTSGTSRSLQIITNNDATTEGDETFRVHLSEPAGCDPNTNYQLGPDVRVTIRASDPATPSPQPTQPPAVITTAPPSSPTPSPTPSDSPTPTPSPTFSPAFAQPEEDTGGAPVGAIVGIVVGVLAAAAGAGILWYRTRLP
jgi:hypothetical protein